VADVLGECLTQPRLRLRESSQPCGQRLHLLIVPIQLGVVEPLFQPEGFLNDFTVLRPKAIALWAGVGTHASRFFHCDERAVVFYRKQPVALPLDMQVKVFEAKKIEKLCGTKTQKTASDEISGAKL